MALKLSVLIATMPSRQRELDELLLNLRQQAGNFSDLVEVILDDSLAYNIGIKRNKLLERAIGEYIVYIDDDDHIASDYVERILAAAEAGADCIGISGWITTNGQKEKKWHISKTYRRWHEAGGVYYRTPNHISPVKRVLALKAGFPGIAHGEDFEYSKRLLPFLRTEVRIPGELYHYDFKSKK